VRYARKFARDNPDMVAYFRKMPAPDEVFLQTVLVNSGKFRLVPDGKHYVDFSRSHNNHPKTLGVADLPVMFASGANWARKFDPGVDAEVFDILDQHVQSESVGVASSDAVGGTGVNQVVGLSGAAGRGGAGIRRGRPQGSVQHTDLRPSR